ncbi:DUF7221 family queuine tRNA-ribosyltransferase-like protein [Paraburkholderia youngii]|uniref:deazapurine DNA modification protein DpdA family protein n=1 Tax=Paraburkholderia youngii TaxID=2782701 RepID=UPI003D1A20BE
MNSSFAAKMDRLLGPVGVIPDGQTNAPQSDGLVMRTGIPHRGGKLASHAFESGYPAMVSANAFFNQKTGCFDIPEHSPLQDVDVALDSAGFVAMMLFKSKGTQAGVGSIYPWTYAAYLELAFMLRPTWYSSMDLCCEPEATNGGIDTDWRIRATATMLEGLLQIIERWQEAYAMEGVRSTTIAHDLRPPVPICQGWELDDYLKSLDLTMQVWDRHSWLAPPTLMGLGSVCRRDLHHPKYGLFAILDGLEGRLPKGTKLHLFGVKGAALKRIKMYSHMVASADSMAWDFSARQEAFQQGISNDMAHRAGKMDAWMANAIDQMKPKAGDQFRLAFS